MGTQGKEINLTVEGKEVRKYRDKREVGEKGGEWIFLYKVTLSFHEAW